MKNKIQRQSEAKVRQEEHNKLTTKQKVLKLDLKFGAGKGAIKERAKLFLQLEREKRQPEPKPEQKQDIKLTNKGKKFYQKPKKS